MSRKNKTLRAFLHQNQNPTIEQVWDAAWKHAQKTFYARSMQDMEKQIADLQAERDLLREQLDAMEEYKMAARHLIGIPASVGICEPIEGFVARPQDILPAVINMALKIEALQAECERLRCIISDIKDWDCDVSGGFLSIPVDLRRRIQEVLAAAPEAAGEPCRTINIENINVDDIVAWADGVQGALGTEYADRVTEMEAAVSRAVMTAIASAPDRCPHGVRRPHECKECADTVSASEALDWAEREFATARQSPGEPGQVETPVKESLMTEQPAPDVTALVEESISVTYVDGVGAGRRSLSDCRDGVRYITIADTVYWPLTPEEAQRLRSAECGRGDFTGPGSTSPDVEALVEALQGLLNIVSDSSGVAGYHLNGNIANWDEFEEVENAEMALSTYHKGSES